jgi:hypothetical protein
VTTARFFFTGEYLTPKPSLKAHFGPTSPIITAVPYWFRLQQCMRRFYDSKRGSRERMEHCKAATCLRNMIATTTTFVGCGL